MLRWAELALFLAPFAAWLAWRRVAIGRGPSRAVLVATLGGLAAFGAGLVWFGLHRSLPPGRYVPARVEGGRIVPGHAGGATESGARTP
jgi:hypothetical protein